MFYIATRRLSLITTKVNVLSETKPLCLVIRDNFSYWIKLYNFAIIGPNEADNTLRDTNNLSDHTKDEPNNCFIIHSK